MVKKGRSRGSVSRGVATPRSFWSGSRGFLILGERYRRATESSSGTNRPWSAVVAKGRGSGRCLRVRRDRAGFGRGVRVGRAAPIIQTAKWAPRRGDGRQDVAKAEEGKGEMTSSKKEELAKDRKRRCWSSWWTAQARWRRSERTWKVVSPPSWPSRPQKRERVSSPWRSSTTSRSSGRCRSRIRALAVQAGAERRHGASGRHGPHNQHSAGGDRSADSRGSTPPHRLRRHH